MTDDRQARLDQIGRLYGNHGFAIAWTAGITGDDAKACRRKGWEQTKPEPAEMLAGIFKTRGERSNPCLVLAPSGVVGIDVDGPVGAARLRELIPGGLPLTVKVLSGRDGGAHYWFKAGPNTKHHKIEFKSDGSIKLSANGYFVAPPAIHPSGNEYRFAPGLGLDEVPMVEMPADALEAIMRAAGIDRRERVEHIAEGKKIAAGGRHDALCSHAGVLRRSGLGEGAILEGLWTFFKHACEPEPPADPHHLEQIAHSAAQWPPGALPSYWWRRNLDAEGNPRAFYVDWQTLWTDDASGPDWLLDNILARGRGHSIFAKHKTGKSLVMLWCAMQLVREGVVVIYLDYEMTEADLRERLEDMGAGPTTDLSLLRYALLPDLPPLDTEAGGAAVVGLVDEEIQHHPGKQIALVIDTISRALAGEENPSDTIRAFYQHTGIELKRRGVTWARLDHAGWNGGHARGSSAKGDDVDVIWELIDVDGGRELRRNAARMGWVPEKVTLLREEAPLRYVMTEESWPNGTYAVAEIMDGLRLPLDVGKRAARAAVRQAGHKFGNTAIDSAVKWRQIDPSRRAGSAGTSRAHPETVPTGHTGHIGARPIENGVDADVECARHIGAHLAPDEGGCAPFPIYRNGHAPTSEPVAGPAEDVDSDFPAEWNL